MRPRLFIGAGCALLLLAPGLAYSQASGTFVAVDNAWQANNQPGVTTLRVTQGAKVEFSYPSGAVGNGHNVDFTNMARPDCPGVRDGGQYGTAPWKGTCTFDKVGTYDFVCTVHTQENMKGRVIVEAPQATPTPTATADPYPSPGATATPTPTPTPQAQPQTALAVRLATAQRGTRVRGRVEVKQGASRLEVTLRRGRLRVGRSTRTVAAAGTVTFSVPLNATSRRTLRRRGRLDVTVAVALTPPGGSKLTRSQRVRLRG